MSLSDVVSKFIEKENLFSRSSTVLCAVSGGRDSMVMLDILRLLGYSLEVAHVNYKLRGTESDQDQELIQAYCRSNQIQLHILEITEDQKNDLERGNLQEKARQIRYDWLEELRHQHHMDVIALAHHQDDVSETFILHALRSSGTRGLRSIQAKNGSIVRPLYDISRSDITAYALSNQVPYRDDVSNLEEKYDRNFIRNKIIHLLEQRWPEANKSIATSAYHIGLDYQLLTELATNSINNFISTDQGFIKIGPLIALKEITDLPELMLFHVLRDYGCSIDMLKDVLRHRSSSGQVWHTATHSLTVTGQYLLIKSLDRSRVSKVLSAEGKYVFPKGIVNIVSVKEPSSKGLTSTEFIDAYKVKWPLTCRSWKAGDKITPLGMEGKSKKVSDILIDQKINILSKEDQLILHDANGKLIWVLGLKLSEHVKYDDQTTHYLRLDWQTS